MTSFFSSLSPSITAARAPTPAAMQLEPSTGKAAPKKAASSGFFTPSSSPTSLFSRAPAVNVTRLAIGELQTARAEFLGARTKSRSLSVAQQPKSKGANRTLVTPASSTLSQLQANARAGIDSKVGVPTTFWGRKRLRLAQFLKRHLGALALTILVLIITSIVILIIYALLVAPIFMTCMVICVTMTCTFIATESSSWGAWHHNREAESRFWSLIGMLGTASLLFSPDSPCPVGLQFPTVGTIMTFGTAIWINHYDRQLERAQLTYTPQLPRIHNTALTNDAATADEKLQSVSAAVSALDYKFVGAKLINQSDIQRQILLIIDVLTNSSAEELNYIVTNANLALLFYKVKDRDIMVWASYSLASRSKVLRLLAEERLSELSVHGRAAVLDALMRMKLTAHANAETWVRNIIVETKGADLTRLKNITDSKGRFHNLHKLIFKDIATPSIRNEILLHIRQQADELNEQDNAADVDDKQRPSEQAHAGSSNGTKPHFDRTKSGRSRRTPTRRKILSDVDDTLFSSGGRFPAGMDASYLPHVLYPGVLTFYRELELGCYDEEAEPVQSKRKESEDRLKSLSMLVDPNASNAVEPIGSSAISITVDAAPSTQQQSQPSINGGSVSDYLQNRSTHNNLSGLPVVAESSSPDAEHQQPSQQSHARHRSSNGHLVGMPMPPVAPDTIRNSPITRQPSDRPRPVQRPTSNSHHDDVWAEGRIGNLTFLSARPHVYKDKSELKTYQLFEALNKQGMHCTPTLLAGALDSGLRVFTGDYHPLAMTKLSNFRAYADLYPEFKFCFVGDNGQGDVICAERMCQLLPEQMEAVFIHQVQPVYATPGYKYYTTTAQWQQMRIHFFTTYVGAALIALKLQLIEITGLRRIAKNVAIAFDSIVMNKLTDDTEARRMEFNDDIRRANEYIAEQGQSELQYILKDQKYHNGALVVTPYGHGQICSFEPVNGVYKVALTTWQHAAGTDSHAHAYVYYPNLHWWSPATVGTLVSTAYGMGIVTEIRSTDGVHVALLECGARAFLFADGLTPIPAALHEKVRTRYGDGIVEAYRPKDQIYQIEISFGTLYMHQDESIEVLEPDRSSCAVM